jgi:amino acid transporter
MYPGPGMMPMGKTHSGNTAETLILIALILQAIITVVGIFGIFLSGSFLFFATFGFSAVFLVFGAIYALVALFFLYAGFEWCYNRARAGNYEGARAWALILGILGLPFGYLIVGILYLVGYMKLGEALNEQRMGMASMGGMPGAPVYMAPTMPQYPSSPPMAPAPGMPPAPSGLPLSPGASPPAPICPRCGQAGTWIQQYGRYYCYRDLQYL